MKDKFYQYIFSKDFGNKYQDFDNDVLPVIQNYDTYSSDDDIDFSEKITAMGYDSDDYDQAYHFFDSRKVATWADTQAAEDTDYHMEIRNNPAEYISEDGEGVIDCDECQGVGEIDGAECDNCLGEGEIETGEYTEAQIEAQIATVIENASDEIYWDVTKGKGKNWVTNVDFDTFWHEWDIDYAYKEYMSQNGKDISTPEGIQAAAYDAYKAGKL